MSQKVTKVTKEELLAKAKKPAKDAMKLHSDYRGKMQTVPKCQVRDFNDFAIYYTPGVAEPCRAIKADVSKLGELTNRWNTIAVVSDCTRVLGLGDIVIPGFFLAILLRFDAHQAGVSTSYTDVHANFPKPYFNSALISYIIGMSTTMAVMIFFNAAQPALLYLVPACLISSLGCAFLRGEVKELLAYSEEDEETKGDDSDAAEEETKKDK